VFRAVGPAALIAVSLVGCGSDNDGPTVTESPDLGASTEKLVTVAAGGEVAVEGAGVKLSIPGGALAADTMITAEVISKFALTDAAMLANNVVEFGPDGLEFAQPVTLELELGSAQIPSGAKVSLAWFDESSHAWIDLPGSKVEGGKVSAETTHFTIFAIRFEVASNGDVVQTGGACKDSFTACGGAIEGTWKIESGCADVGDLLGNAGSQCQGASFSLGIDVTGDITFSGGRITGTMNTTTEMTQVMPKSCIGGSCPQSQAGGVSFKDEGATCRGTQIETEANTIQEAYRVEGAQFIVDADSDETTEFCVTGNRLVVNTTTSEGFSLRWTATR
jgi:hypothetical protein